MVQNGDVAPIFDLASAEHSLAAVVERRLIGTLHGDSTHWDILRLCRGAWTPELSRRIADFGI